GLADEPATTVNANAISFLIVIAFFILTIGWINYVNMTTASSTHRAREIGVRKVLGSRKAGLVRQFLTESFVLNIISAAIAVGLAWSIQPLLDQQFHMHLELHALLKSTLGWAFIAFIVLGAFLSGLYPAFVLSSLKPVAVLKGKIKAQPASLTLRKSLLVFQFALSIILIIGTITVYQQVHYMLSKDLGMNIDQVVVLDRPGKWDTARRQHNLYVQRFKETLTRQSSIASVSMSDELPGKEIRFPAFYRLKDSKDPSYYPIDGITVDENFLKTLDFHFLAGRNFSAQFKTDRNALVMTSSAARRLGFNSPDEAIGKQILSDDSSYSIIGIVDDFHQMSLDKKAEPVVFELNNSDSREFEYYLVKIKGAHTADAIQKIRSSWNDAFRNNPFSFRFLDEDFNRQYSSVIQFQQLFASFASIAIIISCIGLFSLLAFMIQQRLKEIGIRKVLGASVRDIILLLSKDFVRLILLANIVAWPLGWFLMNNWLKDFAYRIQIHFILFLVAGLTALLIALLTISISSIRAALTNPVSTLKSE
ncbi:MAG TPA: FtsX-like permease family protein, partial [Puia sp.]